MSQSRARRAALACVAAAALVFSILSVSPAQARSGDTLEACVNDALAATDPVTPADELTTLDCTGYPGVTSLAGIQSLTSLTNLTIVGAAGADGSLAPLAGLDGLQSLSITNFNISDASSLAGFDALSTLDLSNNHLTSLNGLHACVSFTATGQSTSLPAALVGASATLPTIVAPDGSPVALQALGDHTPVPTLTDTSVTWDGPGTGNLAWSHDSVGECTLHFSGTVSQEVDSPAPPPPPAPPAPPVPSVSSVSPGQGASAGGNTITIGGNGFIGTTSVRIGGVRVAFFRVDSSTRITAITAGTSAGLYPVVVAGPGGTSRSSTFSQFRFVDPDPRPTIASITPATGESAGGETVVVTGTHLDGATFTFGGTGVDVIRHTSTQVTLRTPSHAVGAVSVVATNGGGASQEPVTFAFLSPTRPKPTSLRALPDHGTQLGGTQVTISGENIVNPTDVTVGGAPAKFEYRQPSASSRDQQGSIIVTMPSAVKAGKVAIAVTTVVGTGTVNYTYDKADPPTRLKASITHGTQLGGDTVAVTGTNLTNATSVTIGGIPVSYTIQDLTPSSASTTGQRVVFTTPGSPKAGPAPIVVTTVSGSATVNFTYDKAGVPSSLHLTPGRGTQLGGTVVEIEGKNIANPSSVTVGGVSVPFAEVKATTTHPTSGIRITVPGSAKAVAVPVEVTTVVGSGRTSFEYQKVSAPSDIKVTPNQGSQLGGDTLTVTGTNLDNASAVTVGGVSVPFVETPNPSAKNENGFRIVVTTPGTAVAGATSVQVTTLAGSGTGKFTFLKADIPADLRVSPSTGSQVGGTKVTVSGQNLQNIQSVTIGGVPVTFSAVSANARTTSAPSITFTTPGSATSGAADLVIANVLGSTKVKFDYTKEDLPASLKLNPNTGSQLGGAHVTLSGSNIENITSITIGGVPVAFTKVGTTGATNSTSKVTFTLPGSPLAGSTPVVVTTSVGSTTVTFTYR